MRNKEQINRKEKLVKIYRERSKREKRETASVSAPRVFSFLNYLLLFYLFIRKNVHLTTGWRKRVHQRDRSDDTLTRKWRKQEQHLAIGDFPRFRRSGKVLSRHFLARQKREPLALSTPAYTPTPILSFPVPPGFVSFFNCCITLVRA